MNPYAIDTEEKLALAARAASSQLVSYWIVNSGSSTEEFWTIGILSLCIWQIVPLCQLYLNATASFSLALKHDKHHIQSYSRSLSKAKQQLENSDLGLVSRMPQTRQRYLRLDSSDHIVLHPGDRYRHLHSLEQ
ncbi:hypothetical protein RF11_01028 [Thelohanellus kitauei]|uniref:Uncharacterized protein n=1 Tax=Thelohanellus kitauei TaxID=669202 RepID=A0A0C2MM09_THEKT|nr:hypothetical protein RF11_01028 [Thelohanellus kitauei]